MLMRHVPSEFARKKLTLKRVDGLPVLIQGDKQFSNEEMFEFMGVPDDYSVKYDDYGTTYQKNHRRAYILNAMARISLFGTIILSVPQIKPATQLQQWLPTIEVTIFGTYTWIMAKRYAYRAELARRDQLKMYDGLNLDQWVEDYNLKLYQQLVESGLTFSE